MESRKTGNLENAISNFLEIRKTRTMKKQISEFLEIRKTGNLEKLEIQEHGEHKILNSGLRGTQGKGNSTTSMIQEFIKVKFPNIGCDGRQLLTGYELQVQGRCKFLSETGQLLCPRI